MSARDRYTTKNVCQCGARSEVCWSESGYRFSDGVRIDKVYGPVIIRRHKRRERTGVDDSTADILCQRCGALLHEGEKPRAVG
jgi:hypothetical protein